MDIWGKWAPEHMGIGANGHRSINGELGKIGIWEKRIIEEMGIRGNYIFRGIGHRNKWALVQMGTKANVHLGKGQGTLSSQISVPISPQMFVNGQRGKWALAKNGHSGERGAVSALKRYPKCPEPISPKCSQIGTKANMLLRKWTFGGKRYPKCPKGVPQVPYVHFPQMFTNVHWGKWVLGANVHLRETSTPCALKRYPKCPGSISPKSSQMGTGANGHRGKWALGENGHLKKMVPQVP